MGPVSLAADGFSILSAAVKSLVYVSCLAAAGSAAVLVGLRRLDGEASRAVRGLALAGAAAAGAASLLRVPLQAGFLAGGTWAGAADPVLIGVVLGGPLGDSLAVRFAGLALVALLVVDRTAARAAACLGAVAVCASFAFRGHALGEPRFVLGSLLTVHLLAVAFWIGALAPLLRSIRTADPRQTGALAHEFGQKALAVVAGLAAAGAALLVLLAGDPLGALATPYGRLFALKLAVFAALLGIAARNKLRLTPALRAGDPAAGIRLRRAIRAEIAAVAAILVTTAVLTQESLP